MYESELIIRAKKNGQTYELVPEHALAGDFPELFVRDYTHWLHIEKGFVEWRPLHSPWQSSPQNWQMQSDGQGMHKGLCRRESRLVDLHTVTAKAVSMVLSPIEQATYMHITFDCKTKTLRVHLPRLRLDFFLREGATQLESKQFRDMTIDPNQSIGTLSGLVNKLVLRGETDTLRSVLIPYGDVHFEPNGHHVRVNIDTSTQHLGYDVYHIDRQLGRLIDNGSLKSKLFKIYLHAVTAHSLIDELTGRTGTEEALSTLASAAVQSSPRLDQGEIDLLVLLARLTPRRQYYPQHLQVMQEVEWKRLSPISQHSSFFTIVQSIFERATTLDLFHDEPAALPDAEFRGDQNLLERAGLRDAAYRVHAFGAEHHTTNHDVIYVARDCVMNSIRESQVCHTAKLVDSWSAHVKGHPHLLREIESWGKPLHGPRLQAPMSLGYDMKWLDPPAEFFPRDWCTLHTTLSHSEVDKDKYKIMFFLSTLAYSQHAKQELIQALLSFATIPELRASRLPDYDLFELSHGYIPDRKRLTDRVKTMVRPYYSCPESDLPQSSFETFSEAEERRQDTHHAAVEECLGRFVDVLICQWPCETVRDPVGTGFDTYISVNAATEDARRCFRRWYNNTELKSSIGHIQNTLDDLNAGDQEIMKYSVSQPHYHHRKKQSHVDFIDIIERPAPSLTPARLETFESWIVRQDDDVRDNSDLESLLWRLLSDSPGRFEQRYATDLMQSFDSLPNSEICKLRVSSNGLRPLLKENRKRCKVHVNDVYQTIRNCLETEASTMRRMAREAMMWPRLSTASLLLHLACRKFSSLREDWKRCLIQYGMAITNLQRAERLLACVGKESELLSELGNSGRQGWDPVHYPDWLLFEIENNISIRQVQAQIAQEMMSPSSGENSIMQLNMGEGKSSVIVPIVAAALADGKRLVRVVVLKPLSNQMFQLLRRTLSGMLERRIFHMPISRSIRMDKHKARQIQELCEECMRNGGILLVQPEHLLSFELMGQELLLCGESELGNTLIETQRWLEDNSRDILDESDEILSVRFELIYTMGSQRAIEFGPDRWSIIQHVLGLVSRFAPQVLESFPQGLELRWMCSGSFPWTRILQPSAATELMNMVACEICRVGLPGVPIWNFPQNVRAVLFSFLTDPNIKEAESEPLQDLVFAVESTKKSLLLLRGLIAGGILVFALQQKRWRVNYGLDLSRTMLAVPYRAKDNPATRAEFSHPDATIVLTCLSYYYGGLSDELLRTAFEKLLLSDHATEEYESWVQDAPELPLAFRRLTGINLSDPVQCSRKVFPFLRLAKGLIDFYMSQIVFPREMKEFPHKLSTSGWNIARIKTHPTTGFSGTNDSRYMLPLSIEQRDLPAHFHTNAAVLDCLLRPENSFKHAMQESKSETLDGKSLLQIVVGSEPPVRVILDVGAQVLEWKNEEVVREWLSRVPEAQAAVFFDDGNSLSVLSRDDTTESLMVSPFARQMDHCLVYLDEAHTRGTDLKLPLNYRAAVTLGPDLTKDRLVQGMGRIL